MYRNDEIYDALKRIVVDIFIDYDVKELPVDEKVLCTKMGVALIPYSEFDSEARELLMRRSKYGFFVKGTTDNPPSIYYNDKIGSKGAQRFTIFHELKHYVCEDADEKDDDLADFFARFIMCPIPFLLLKKIDSPNEVASYCGTSLSVAYNVCSNLKNRKKKYGLKLFDYEIPLIKQLENVLLEFYQGKESDVIIYD